METHFSVDVCYLRAEYVQIVRNAIRRKIIEEQGAEITEANANASEGSISRWASNCFISLIFFYKRFRLGVCCFEVSDAGLTRTSKMGTKTVNWFEVKRVHRDSVVYLIELAVGAMPIPVRCMSSSQRESFDALISKLQLGQAREI
jgi:hypothetical protein